MTLFVPRELSDDERDVLEECLDSVVRPFPDLKRPVPLAKAVETAEALWECDD